VAKKILALVSEPGSGAALKKAMNGERAAGAEAWSSPRPSTPGPASGSPTPTPAIERAEEVQEETVERMDEEGIDAAGDTGESDPLLAIQDALATLPADEIVLFTHAVERGTGSRRALSSM
jgi:hypothetical protein